MKRSTPAPAVGDLLGPVGPLSREAFYEFRPGQVTLAESVAETLRLGGVLLAEAGTGTGKSLAYLLPALLQSRRVVVSTRTKALQEQLARKDIPLCERLLGRGIRAVVVKGRANYLCRHYYERFLKEPLLRSQKEARLFGRFKRWASETATGDKAEWEGIPEDLPLWADVNARGERCLGSKCPLYAECFVVLLRREAEAAELVVTNHHLLFADLALKGRWDTAALPEYRHLVLDEAHEAEDAATSFFGVSASRRMLEEWVRDATPAAASDPGGAASQRLAEASQAARLFFGAFEGPERREEVRPGEWPPREASLLARMGAALDAAALALEGVPDPSGEAEGLLMRLDAWREALDFVVRQGDEEHVRWLEVTPRNVTFGASPIEVGPILRGHLFSRLDAAVLTSATLTVGGEFGYLRDRLGLPEECQELRLPSPFDFESQGLLYVPAAFPAPNSEEFARELKGAVRRLIGYSRGRAFVLCTSVRAMRAIAEDLEDLDHPVLVQGDEPKGVLLDRFREAGDAVLVATSSFWQGVDVQGEALSLVVLDKLPFAVPTDPLVKARVENLRKKGREPFLEYQVPTAAILLQQGAGRLIRSKRDRGVVACFDVRLRTKAYGKILLRSLPPFRVTGREEDVADFFRPDPEEDGR